MLSDREGVIVHMKTIRNFFVGGCSVLLLTQCASQDEIRDLQYQLRTVNQKVEDVKTNAVNPMQKRQASSVSKIDQVEDETMRIKSTLEESSSQSHQFREQTKENIANLQKSVESMRTANETKIAELNQKIAVLDEKLSQVGENFSKAQQARIGEAEKRAQEAAKKAEEAKQRAASASSSATTAPSTSAAVVNVNPNTKKTKVGAAPAAPRNATIQKERGTASGPT
jgi:DNA anti-recombination protein RmuC